MDISFCITKFNSNLNPARNKGFFWPCRPPFLRKFSAIPSQAGNRFALPRSSAEEVSESASAGNGLLPGHLRFREGGRAQGIRRIWTEKVKLPSSASGFVLKNWRTRSLFSASCYQRDDLRLKTAYFICNCAKSQALRKVWKLCLKKMV